MEEVACGAIEEEEVPLLVFFEDFDLEDFGGLEEGVPAEAVVLEDFCFGGLELEEGAAPGGVELVAAWRAAVLILSLTIIG